MRLFRFLGLWLWTAFRHSVGTADSCTAVIIVIVGLLSWLSGRLPPDRSYPAIVEFAMHLTEWQILAGIFGVIILARLVLAPYWLYESIVEEKMTIQQKLDNYDLDYSRKRRIELIEKEEYPRKLPEILKRMRMCLEGILKEAQSKNVTIKKLWDSLKSITPTDFAEVLNQRTYDENVVVLYKYNRRMQLSKDGITLNEDSNGEWIALDDELEGIKKDMPDLLLKDNIMAYYQALKGICYLRLFYYHMNKAPSSELKDAVMQSMTHYRYPEDLLDYCLTRVVKRIQELKCGDELQWTQKEISKWK